MNQEELKEILELHRKWLFNIEGGKKANLSNADLRYANLSNADLSNANLRNANLRNADLRYANLSNADLSNADLSNANLRNANLSNAKTNNRYIQIGCIGSKKAITTYCFDEDKITCGCFTGTLDEFRLKVLESYPDPEDQFHKEYIGFINYLEGLK